MKIIEKERSYSWSIPVYFGETDKFVVVTSPAFVNGGGCSPRRRAGLCVRCGRCCESCSRTRRRAESMNWPRTIEAQNRTAEEKVCYLSGRSGI